ncbi:MAG: hypothetical protein IKT38_08315 [Clostridia bacterium]|nr:hypothetical protein [Clostridia bacterium]
MKNFWKILIAVLAVFGAIVGALVIIDKIQNKNRIKGDYLECDTGDEFEDIID